MLKAKKLLLSIMKRDKIIELKLEELERQKRLCEVRAVTFEERVQSSGTDTSSKVIEYIQMKDEVDEYIAETLKIKNDVMKKIDEINDDKCVVLLYKRYFQRWSWEDIADELDLSDKRVYQLHDRALKELDEKIRKN